MYDRDATVERNEELQKLSLALDHLVEVVSKDDTSKSILEALKEKTGLKDAKEVPIMADGRADDLHPVSGRRARRGIADVETLNYSNLNRLNTAFKALQGDLGAFQKTLMNSVVWGNKAADLSKRMAVASPETLGAGTQRAGSRIADMISKPGGLKEFFDQPLQNQIMQRKIGNIADMVSKPGGMKQYFNDKRSDAEILGEVKNAAKPMPLVQPSKTANTIDSASLARIATTTALIAAPIVMGKMVQAGAMHQIEGNRQFRTMDGMVATSYAMYDMNRLMTNMKYSRGISGSMDSLLRSEAGFQQTIEPIKTLGTNVINSFMEGGLDTINTILKPVGRLAKGINENNRNNAIIQEAARGAGIGGLLGGIGGGIAGFFGGGPLGAIGGAMWGAGVGGGGGAVIGAAGEILGGARMKELDEIIGDANDKAKRGMVHQFALEMVARPIAPVRRFVN